MLAYSTYLGGSGGDRAVGVAVDQAANTYVIGQTDSSDFPTANAAQGAFGGGPADVFISKLQTLVLSSGLAVLQFKGRSYWSMAQGSTPAL